MDIHDPAFVEVDEAPWEDLHVPSEEDQALSRPHSVLHEGLRHHRGVFFRRCAPVVDGNGFDPVAFRDSQSPGFGPDRKSTRLNSSHGYISYAVFCLKKKTVDGGSGGSRLA